MPEDNHNPGQENEPGAEGLAEFHQKSRRAFIQRNLTGQLLIKSTEREWELSKQSRSKYFLYPRYFSNTALQEWHVFMQDIKTHSGKHRHQGGLAIFVLEGRGYSILDGQRKDWKKGDLILLSIKPQGVEHQHFNTEPGAACRWMAFIFIPFYDQIASYTQALELSPLYKKEQ